MKLVHGCNSYLKRTEEKCLIFCDLCMLQNVIPLRCETRPLSGIMSQNLSDWISSPSHFLGNIALTPILSDYVMLPNMILVYWNLEQKQTYQLCIWGNTGPIIHQKCALHKYNSTKNASLVLDASLSIYGI
jgi:hypothetical protein